MNREEELLYKILDYPIVQYITLKPIELYSDLNWQDPFPTQESRLYVFKNREEANNKLLSFKVRVNQIDPAKLTDSMIIITNNIELLDIKYRTFSVVLVGKSHSKSLYVYSLTTRDFYRQSLNFLLYNEKGDLIQSKVVRLN